MHKAQMKRQQRKSRRKNARVLDRVRNAAAVDGMFYRSSTLGEPDESQRTVTATLATEQPVPMWDYRTRGVIDEVLLASGGRFPERMPMLDDHSRFGANSVMGSIRSPVNNGDRWRGTLHFASNAGQEVDHAWERVRQGHITDVSVGYRYAEGDFVDIPPGQSRNVGGRDFVAGRRAMRVVTNWTAREASLTPIGADDQAKIGRGGGTPQNGSLEFGYELGAGDISGPNQRSEDSMKTYLKWLHERGMDQAITEQSAALDWARSNLAGELLNQFTVLCRSEEIPFEVRSTVTNTPTTTTATPAIAAAAPLAVATTAQPDEQYRVASARAAYVSQMGEGVPEDVRQRALDEAWSVDRINNEFRTARTPRTEPVSGHAPAGHVVNRTLTTRGLQAAILMRAGLEIDHPMFRSVQAQHVLGDRLLFGTQVRERGEWLVNHSRNLARGGPTADDAAARAIDQGFSLQRMSLLDICRAALEVDGVRHDSYDRDEIIMRSFSTASLNAIFTTNFGAQMVAGFMDAPDTTGPWTREAELPNFQTVERFQMHKFSKLKRTDRNETPGDADVQAVLESYKLHRYAEKFTIDEMDIIDDRFGALDTTPQDMGEAARVLRPDLVYSILLGNPTMAQDNTALFATAHGNYTASGAGLAFSTLEAAKSAMAVQTSNGRLCSIRAQYLIVPESKDWTARQIVGSGEIRNTTDDTLYGTMNAARGSFQVISEPRLDVGVVDPSTGTSNSGQAGSWGLATAGGRYGIEVGHLRGTGRAPVVRRFELTEGRIGMGWLVIMYNAAKAIGYQGLSWQKT